MGDLGLGDCLKENYTEEQCMRGLPKCLGRLTSDEFLSLPMNICLGVRNNVSSLQSLKSLFNTL